MNATEKLKFLIRQGRYLRRTEKSILEQILWATKPMPLTEIAVRANLSVSNVKQCVQFELLRYDIVSCDAESCYKNGKTYYRVEDGTKIKVNDPSVWNMELLKKTRTEEEARAAMGMKREKKLAK